MNMDNFFLIGAAIIIAIATGTARINLEKYRVKVCLEQYELIYPQEDWDDERRRAMYTLQCMGVSG